MGLDDKYDRDAGREQDGEAAVTLGNPKRIENTLLSIYKNTVHLLTKISNISHKRQSPTCVG